MGSGPGLAWRTVRHLSAEQWLYRAVCRGRRGLMGLAPHRAWRRLNESAARLPMPDPDSPALRAASRPVLRLQDAVHGAYLDGIAQGRFTLLNRDYDFGAPGRIDWRGTFREGNNPLRRMTLAYMGYVVPLLARGDDEGVHVTLEVLRSLLARNPFSAEGVFRDVWSAYAASHRLVNLLSGLALHRAAGGAPDADAAEEILHHARLCAAFVRANLERDLQYNHLLKNLVALAVFAAAAPEAGFAFLAASVDRAVGQNVLADGGHAERSPMYHALGLLDLETLLACGLSAEGLEDAAARMRAALGVMTHPDGEIALFNDSWIGEAPAPGTAHLRDGTCRLPETGYVRIGEGGDAAILDCGPCGPDDNPGHAHADFLSVEASVGGGRLFTDPGVPTYTAGPLRDLSRSAAVHNGPHLAGAEPIEFWKSFRVGRRGRASEIADATLGGLAPLWCAGRQDGYGRLGVEARRYVGLWPGRALLVCDLWLGPAEREAAARFLVPGDWTPAPAAAPVFRRDGLTVTLEALEGTPGPVAPDRYWPRFGAESPAHGVTLRPAAHPGARAAALLACWGRPPDLAPAALDTLFRRLGSC